MGMHRDSLLAIGGFDESYVGWGREDSDFVVRLIHKKTTVRSGRLSTCVAHLWHHEVSRNRLSVNDKFLQDTLTDESHILAKSSVLKSL